MGFATVCSSAGRARRRAIIMTAEPVRRIAEIAMSAEVLTCRASSAVKAGPASAPIVPPAAM